MSEENKRPQLSEIENPALIYAMYEMKEKKTQEAEGKFISELRKATFISPAIIEVQDENGNYKIADGSPAKGGETRVSFMMLNAEDGTKFLPAFTSMDEVRKWRQEEKLQTVVTKFDQYINIVGSDPNGPAGVVIDPFGSNIILQRPLIEGLKSAIDQRNQQVAIADLKEHPEELEKTLSEFFDEKGNIEKAYMQLMRRGNDVSLLLIVDHDIPEGTSDEQLKVLRKELFDSIAETAKPVLKGQAFSIAAFTDDFGKKAVDNKFPFYTR